MSANHELREFLGSRRARLRPEDVGVAPLPGHRRVPGLRREEVAQLAGVSVDYYIRLEQGRSRSVSTDVLDAVARALRLDEAECAHLSDLARPARPRVRNAETGQRVRRGLQLLVDSLSTPAFVLGRRTDVLATNAMARALLCDFDALEPRERNHARWVFLNPLARERYVDWDAVARDNVAALRLDAGRFPEDAELNALIGELTVKSREFSGWWVEHDVMRHANGLKRYRHPVAGEIEIHYEALTLPGDADQTLFIYSVEPGSESAQGLDLLASWIAEPAERATHRSPLG